jgi:scyllo-inositol 2-dehydrogenase (NADP+)
MKKVALIGIGKMGISHLAIANQTPGIEVKAICDTSKPLLRAIEKNTKFIGYTDYKKMLTELTLDGVMILVPNAYHFELAKYCIERGIHVFIEKPFTLSYKNSASLVDLANKHQVMGQVGYVNRYNLIFREVKKLLNQNIIGDISSYKNSMIGGVVLKENKGWRNDYKKGGGCLYDYGPHCFDLATYFFGDNVKVQSSILKKVFSTNVDDIVNVTLLHNNSIVGSNYINWSDNTVRKASNNIEIIGKEGKILANKQEFKVFLNEDNIKLNLTKGWNEIYVTDQNTDIFYYLRGEEFSLQLIEFSNMLNGKIDKSISSLESASITDRIIEESKKLNKEII